MINIILTLIILALLVIGVFRLAMMQKTISGIFMIIIGVALLFCSDSIEKYLTYTDNDWDRVNHQVYIQPYANDADTLFHVLNNPIVTMNGCSWSTVSIFDNRTRAVQVKDSLINAQLIAEKNIYRPIDIN